MEQVRISVEWITDELVGGLNESGMDALVEGDSDQTLALLLPLLILLTTLLFLLLIFLIFLLIIKRKRVVLSLGGPIDLQLSDDFILGGYNGLESRWLDSISPKLKAGYLKAKDWQIQYPPNSLPTSITLSQFLTIQEKGVSAWSFEPDYELNSSVYVQQRTEITFLSDGIGMDLEQGGGCCVQSNLPLPRINECYYWECKIYELEEGVEVGIGLGTKPFPSFRLPGWNKYSVGYSSSDGFKSHSYPFTATSYGPPLLTGDVLGIGYRPLTGTVFFTRNGKKLEDAFIGFNKFNLFPTVGANGACEIHVNFGQMGFVFIEANVKKWGLAPMGGTLAPPPAYGSEGGSVLLEFGGVRSGEGGEENLRLEDRGSSSNSNGRNRRERNITPPNSQQAIASTSNASTFLNLNNPSISNRPINPSPLRHSTRIPSSSSPSTPNTFIGGSNSIPISRTLSEDSNSSEIRNPPTPGALDISLRSLHAFPQRDDSDDEEEIEFHSGSDDDEEEVAEQEEVVVADEGEAEEEERTRVIPTTSPIQTRIILPPAYNPIDPHMYAPGVAETILEDAFASNSLPNLNFQNSLTRQFLPNSFTLSNSSTPSTSTTNPRGGDELGGPVGWVDWLIGRNRISGGGVRLEEDDQV